VKKDYGQCVIRCVSGTLWITQEGDFKDHFFAVGSEFEIDRPGVTVVQAFTPASISILREENDVDRSATRQAKNWVELCLVKRPHLCLFCSCF
jgi:Protein of unknown function (DUF2917)